MKQQLEDELKVQVDAQEEMRRDFQDTQQKMSDYLEQLLREDAETFAAIDKRSLDLVSDSLEQRAYLCDVQFHWRHLCNRAAELDDECVQKDMELQRLNGECASNASTIWALKAENERLYEGVTNFEQLALASANDLEQAQSEIASLKEALAAAQAEVMPAEEREKAALLLLEKETQASQLEEKLKEMEDALARLTAEKAAAVDAAEIFSDANQGLKDAMLSLEEELSRELERKENRVDCDLQTDDSTEADLSTFPKIDCEVQTDDTGDNEIVSKLAGTQLEVNRLNVSLRRLVFEKIALEESRKRHESVIEEEQRARLALETKVEELMNQVAAKSAEADKQQKMINSLQASLQSQQKGAQNNERLKAEVSNLKQKVLNPVM
ncbi:hypothetical protein MTO96_014754 [Rhipicephalus appendiculatus]